MTCNTRQPVMRKPMPICKSSNTCVSIFSCHHTALIPHSFFLRRKIDHSWKSSCASRTRTPNSPPSHGSQGPRVRCVTLRATLILLRATQYPDHQPLRCCLWDAHRSLEHSPARTRSVTSCCAPHLRKSSYVPSTVASFSKHSVSTRPRPPFSTPPLSSLCHWLSPLTADACPAPLSAPLPRPPQVNGGVYFHPSSSTTCSGHINSAMASSPRSIHHASARPGSAPAPTFHAQQIYMHTLNEVCWAQGGTVEWASVWLQLIVIQVGEADTVPSLL